MDELAGAQADPSTSSREPKRSSAEGVQASSGLDLDVIVRRVDDLERRYLELLERENRRLLTELESARGRRQASSTDSGDALERATEGTTTRLRSPAYLADAFLEVERKCEEMELHSRLEEWPAARAAKLAAANVGCRALRRVCEDADFKTRLRDLAVGKRQPQRRITDVLTSDQPSSADSYSWERFKKEESALLQLLGLSASLASDQIEGARSAYNTQPTVYLAMVQDPAEFIRAVEQVRDAVCMSTDLMALGVKSERSRKRWKTILVSGVGGTLIVGANAAATTLLGPVAVAVSAALGSAAVGVAAAAANE